MRVRAQKITAGKSSESEGVRSVHKRRVFPFFHVQIEHLIAPEFVLTKTLF